MGVVCGNSPEREEWSAHLPALLLQQGFLVKAEFTSLHAKSALPSGKSSFSGEGCVEHRGGHTEVLSECQLSPSP